MLSRVRSSRGRPINAPAAFIQPCRPTVAKQPPRGEGWVHELKHDGYRLQIHVRDGRVRLFTKNGAEWSERYSLVVKAAARIKGSAVIDAEVVCLDAEGIADFDPAQSRLGSRGGRLCFCLLARAEGEIALPKHFAGGGHPAQKMQLSGDHPQKIIVEVFLSHFSPHYLPEE